MRPNTHLSVTVLGCWVAVASASVSCQRSSTSEPTAEKPAAVPSAAPSAPSASGSVAHAKPMHASPASNPHSGGTELGITWSDPEGWERVATNNPMRAAQYNVPAVKGDSEPAEVTVFYFGAKMGGGVDDNLNRWVDQFKGVKEGEVKRTTREIKGMTHHLVHIPMGEYAGMSMMGGASPSKPGYGLLGAVTVAPSGKYFFKMTGPSETVAANQAKFEGLLESVKNK